jgi:hypothetical protein
VGELSCVGATSKERPQKGGVRERPGLLSLNGWIGGMDERKCFQPSRTRWGELDAECGETGDELAKGFAERRAWAMPVLRLLLAR